MHNILNSKKDDLIRVCQELQVKRLYAFGSVVTESLREDSDLDFLISFLDHLSPEEYADNYFALHYKLREIFHREIDIVTERSLSNPYFIASVNETKSLIYEA